MHGNLCLADTLTPDHQSLPIPFRAMRFSDRHGLVACLESRHRTGHFLVLYRDGTPEVGKARQAYQRTPFDPRMTALMAGWQSLPEAIRYGDQPRRLHRGPTIAVTPGHLAVRLLGQP